MCTKKPYEAPHSEMFLLTMGSAILDVSQTGTGADVTFETESDFDDFFNPEP